MSGPIALVGSGEFTPVMDEVDRALLQGRDQRVVFLPTAAAPEGDARVAYWVDLGLAHYRRLGVSATPLMVLDRSGADDADLVDQIGGAGLVYLSGGNPTYLAATLAGSRVGDAIRKTWQGGSAVAGCSAGAIALMESVPDIRTRLQPEVPGLGLVRGLSVIPHFDQIERWAPGTLEWAVDANPPGIQLVGIDEDTALVGGPGKWTAMGRGSAWLLRKSVEPVRYSAGDVLTLG